MPGAAGYIVVFNEQRAEVFEDYRDDETSFSEAVPEFDHSRNKALLCFVLAKNGHITHVARGRRGVRAGTGQRRLNLTDIRPLTTPVATTQIEQRVARNVRRYVSQRLAEGGLLPPRTFSDFVAALTGLVPELRDLLRRYSAEREERIARLSRGARVALAAQKEAVMGALHIADIDRAPLLDWSPGGETPPKSFLEGLEESRVMEDNMIWHDFLEPLPGFQEVKRSITGVARFRGEFVDLEVIVANRTPLERQTGADLVYFNATFTSFILVQYKAMEREGKDNEATFRLPNAQLAAEIARMDAILESLNGAKDPDHRHGYRLNANPFFLKLCPRIILNPDNVGLTPGMYLPLDYWRFVEKDADMVGERGGRLVTYRNVGRYLNNSEFAGMVRAAWVGTTPSQTALLTPLIEALLKEGRAVVIAVKHDKPDRPRGPTELDPGDEPEQEPEASLL